MPRVSPTAFSAAALLLLFLFADPLRSQSTTATLNGQVTDPRGAVVPNAAVEAVNIDTGVASATRSNGDGLYSIRGLSCDHQRGEEARARLGPWLNRSWQTRRLDRAEWRSTEGYP
jgi:hypothetical protein